MVSDKRLFVNLQTVSYSGALKLITKKTDDVADEAEIACFSEEKGSSSSVLYWKF
jgi:hypothetical protein